MKIKGVGDDVSGNIIMLDETETHDTPGMMRYVGGGERKVRGTRVGKGRCGASRMPGRMMEMEVGDSGSTR